jgi:hypothetical protein
MMRRAGLVLLAILAACAAVAADGGPGAADPSQDGTGGSKAGLESALPSVPPYAFGIEDLPAVSGRAVTVLPPAMVAGSSAQYRFGPGQPWIPFIDPIELGAAYGEDRLYTLEVKAGVGQDALSRTIHIDRLSPRPPQVNPAAGLYRGGIKLAFTAEGGSTVQYALYGEKASGTAFSPYDPANPPSLEPPAVGSASYVLVAYAVDAAGNRSLPVRSAYRLAGPGPAYAAPAEAPQPPAMVQDPLTMLAEPGYSRLPGMIELEYKVPEGSQLYIAINPDKPPAAVDDFLPLPAKDGIASLAFPVPPGWKGSADVYVGLQAGAGFAYRPMPLALKLSYQEGQATPAEPSILAAGSAAPAFLFFPAYDGSIRFSLDGGEWMDYSAPLPLRLKGAAHKVSWYGLGPTGDESPRASKDFTLPDAPPALALIGPALNAVLNADQELLPSGPGVLRYEMSADGSIPPEPGPASPLVGQGLKVSCPDGSERSFVIRYRAFTGEASDAAGDEGGMLRFTIDHVAPPPPVLRAGAEGYSSKPLSVSVSGAEGGVFVALSVDGAEAEFSKVSAPLSLSGSLDGPVFYRLRAYTLDAAGNRSAEAEPLSVVVDIATMYVDGEAAPGGDGSRGHPFASLDEAITAALGGERSVSAIELRGSLSCEKTISLSSGSLSIRGGFDAEWKPLPGALATIASRTTGPLFELGASRLALTGLRIEALGQDSAVLFSAQGADLRLDRVSLQVSAAGEALLFDASASTISLSDSSLSIAGATSASAFRLEGGQCGLAGTSVEAGVGVKYFNAITAQGGRLAVHGGRLSSRALLGTRLLALSSVELDMDGAYLDIRGGGAFLSVAGLSDCAGRIANTRLYVDWGGSASLFRIQGKAPLFVHDSFFARTAKGSLRFFECAGGSPIIRNSIMDGLGDRNEFLRTDSKPAPGDLAANCLWGFSGLVTGALSLRDLAALNAYNSAERTVASHPNITESPGLTFAAQPPESFKLSASSACVDAALPLAGVGSDFEDDARPALPPSGGTGKPDIGADEKAFQ